MISIFIVLIALALIFPDQKQQQYNENRSEYISKAVERTNAVLENRLLCQYIYEDGDDLDTAYEKAVAEVGRMGFHPCIPKDIYQHSASFFTETGKSIRGEYGKRGYQLCRSGYDKLDGYYVKYARDAYIKVSTNPYKEYVFGGVTFEFYDVPDDFVYDDFPVSESEFDRKFKIFTMMNRLHKIGDIASIRGIGAVQVYDISLNNLGVCTYYGRLLSDPDSYTTFHYGDKNFEKWLSGELI